MLANWKSRCVLLALVCTVLGSSPDRASAITAELARKCNALTAKQFPPRQPGNPAAGSVKGSGSDRRAYFDKCVANGGKVDDEAKGRDLGVTGFGVLKATSRPAIPGSLLRIGLLPLHNHSVRDVSRVLFSVRRI